MILLQPHTCDEYTKEFPLYSQTNIEDKYVMNPEYLAVRLLIFASFVY